MSSDDLRRAVDLLLGQVGHWTTARWESAGLEGASRRDLMHGLVQHLADLAADTEGLPRRPVPRLDNALALPDQLRVVTGDLIAAAPQRSVLASAAERVARLRAAL